MAETNGRNGRRKRSNSISGQFAARLIAMLECPAYRALSLAAQRVLSRLEIELAHHGGTDNGSLPCTYNHFHEYGIHRHAIGPAIREVVALGFVRVTQRGVALNGHLRQMSLYRLTYRPVAGEREDGTHEWRAIKTIEEAEEIAKKARAEVDPRSRSLGWARARRQASKNKRPVPETVTATSAENRHCNAYSPVPETVTTSPVPETGAPSISRSDAG